MIITLLFFTFFDAIETIKVRMVTLVAKLKKEGKKYQKGVRNKKVRLVPLVSKLTWKRVMEQKLVKPVFGDVKLSFLGRCLLDFEVDHLLEILGSMLRMLVFPDCPSKLAVHLTGLVFGEVLRDCVGWHQLLADEVFRCEFDQVWYGPISYILLQNHLFLLKQNVLEEVHWAVFKRWEEYVH